MTAPTAAPKRPTKRARPPAAAASSSSSSSRASPTAAPASRAGTLRRVRRGAFPGRRVRAEVGRAKRDYANARAVEVLEPSPDRDPDAVRPRGRRLPGLALAGPALRAPARAQAASWSRTRSRGSAGFEDFELEPIVPAVGPLALPQQDGVLVRSSVGRTARACAWLSRARAVGPRRRRARLRARVRAQQRRAQLRARLVRRAGPERATTGARRTGFLRNLVVREGRRTGDLQVRLVTLAG